MRRLLALKDLVHAAIEKTTDLVQETHESAAAKPIRILSTIEPLGEAVQAVGDVHRLTASAVYATIRATNEGIRRLEDVGVALLASAAEEAGVADLVAASGTG